MCTYIGAECGEDGQILRHFYAAVYGPDVFSGLPWGDEQFDCVILVCDAGLARRLAEDIAHDVVRANVGWVETTGAEAEQMHDLIDVASVKAGRQNMVGDGDPMASWHQEAVTIPQMAKAACLCSGGADHVLVLVVGDNADLAEVVQEVRRRLI